MFQVEVWANVGRLARRAIAETITVRGPVVSICFFVLVTLFLLTASVSTPATQLNHSIHITPRPESIVRYLSIRRRRMIKTKAMPLRRKAQDLSLTVYRMLRI